MIRTQHLKIQNGGFNTAAIFAKSYQQCRASITKFTKMIQLN